MQATPDPYGLFRATLILYFPPLLLDADGEFALLGLTTGNRKLTTSSKADPDSAGYGI
jgi:hypothetical protein